MNVNIGDFLSNFNKPTNRGECKICGKAVVWGRLKLASHKRSNCVGASEEEKELFRTTSSATSSNNISMEEIEIIEETVETTAAASAPTKETIDSALATLFYRTGISFRIAESEAFRNFVTLLNPTYAEVMPKSRTVSGTLLNKEYSNSMAKLQKILGDCTELTLISDGWTNCRGDHIVNFLLKAPSKPSVFYKSISTVGIIQDTAGVAGAISNVIDEVGKEKIVCLVTDNAPVMVAAHQEIEGKYPNISAFGCAAHCINLLIKDILAPHSAGKLKYIFSFRLLLIFCLFSPLRNGLDHQIY